MNDLKNILIIVCILLFFTFSSCRSKRNHANVMNGDSTEIAESDNDLIEPDDQTDGLNSHAGAPAYPGVINYQLPDGYVLKIYLRGDEHGHIALTKDGYLIDFNSEGFYVYVLEKQDGSKVLSKIIARNPQDRTPEEWDVIGEPEQK